MVKFNHFNFNVLNLEKSLEFYEKALGLKAGKKKRMLLTAPLSWCI